MKLYKIAAARPRWLIRIKRLIARKPAGNHVPGATYTAWGGCATQTARNDSVGLRHDRAIHFYESQHLAKQKESEQ